jgi:hypothetical protein
VIDTDGLFTPSAEWNRFHDPFHVSVVARSITLALFQCPSALACNAFATSMYTHPSAHDELYPRLKLYKKDRDHCL